MSMSETNTVLYDQAITWLVTLESPNLSEAELQAFEQWLATSPDHQRAYIRAENLWQKGVALQHVPRRQPAQQRYWAPLAVAATLILAIGLYFGVNRPDNSATTNTYTTQVGEQLSIQLADSSNVKLNTNSQLTFSIKNNRRIAHLLKGEAFFSVTKDSQRPFDVYTPSGQVRVYGTRFLVKNLEQDTLVTVVEGKVGVAAPQGETESDFVAAAVLTKDMQQTVTAAEQGQPPETIDTSASASWLNNMLIYQNKALADVVTDLNRYFTQQIILDDKTIAQRKVVLALKIADFDSTLKTLTDTLKLKYTSSDNGQTVTLRGQ